MAKSKYTDEQKLKALALIKMDKPLREISDQIDVAYPTLLKWRTELEEAQETQEVEILVNAKKATVHRIAEETTKELRDLQNDAFGDNKPKGELMPRPELTDDITEIVDGVDGYQVLSTKLQNSAVLLAKRIDALAAVTTGPVELQLLIDGLATLQTSFFNKNITNVNVLNATQGGTPGNGQTFQGFKHKD